MLEKTKIFSDAVIAALFMIKIFLKLPYRDPQELAKFIQPLLKFIENIPGYTSILWRAKTLDLPKISNKRP
jgi:hypothetical protein